MKEILTFERLITGSIIKMVWILFSVFALLSVPGAVAKMYLVTEGCGRFEHRMGSHFCEGPPLGEAVALAVMVALSAILAVLVARIVAELVIVIFRIHELQRANQGT